MRDNQSTDLTVRTLLPKRQESNPIPVYLFSLNKLEWSTSDGSFSLSLYHLAPPVSAISCGGVYSLITLTLCMNIAACFANFISGTSIRNGS